MAGQIARDLFVTGLRNAHAMERQAQELMERQSKHLTDFPEVLARARQHLEETRQQLRRLEECLDVLGESPSTVKDTAMWFVAAVGHAIADDEILKNTFANDAFEHYEIAAYKSLLTLAERAGVTHAAPPLQTSLEEKGKMAQWIDDHMKEITLQYIAKEEREAAT